MKKILLSFCSALAVFELSASNPYVPTEDDWSRVIQFHTQKNELENLKAEEKTAFTVENPSEEELDRLVKKYEQLNIRIGETEQDILAHEYFLAIFLEQQINRLSRELNTPATEKLKAIFSNSSTPISSVRILDPTLMIDATCAHGFQNICTKLNLKGLLNSEDDELLTETIVNFISSNCEFSSEKFKGAILKNIVSICNTRLGREFLSLVIAKYISYPDFSDVFTRVNPFPLNKFSFVESREGSFHRTDFQEDGHCKQEIGIDANGEGNIYYTTVFPHSQCVDSQNGSFIYPRGDVPYKIKHELGHFLSQSIVSAADLIHINKSYVVNQKIFSGAFYDQLELFGDSAEIFQIQGIALLRFGDLQNPRYVLLLNPYSDLAMAAELGKPIRDSHLGASVLTPSSDKNQRIMLSVPDKFGRAIYLGNYTPNFAYYGAMLECFGSSLSDYTIRIMYNNKFLEYMKRELALEKLANKEGISAESEDDNAEPTRVVQESEEAEHNWLDDVD